MRMQIRIPNSYFHFDVDPDLTFHLHEDQYSDMTFLIDADSDPLVIDQNLTYAI